MKPHRIVFVILLTIPLLGTKVGYTQLLDEVSVHGFGSWAAGRTNNENQYFLWDEDGNFEHLEFSLNIRSDLSENVSVYVQPAFNETRGGKETGVDYAFAEWYISDLLSFRAGKVKAPFMLYTEVHDVGTVRPFFQLPTGIYYSFGAEAYKGIGITGVFHPDSDSDWEVYYDVYGGTMNLQPFFFVDDFIETSVIKDMVGGRFIVHTPLEGLHLGVSAYIGRRHSTMDADETVWGITGVTSETPVLGASAEYLSDRWDIRGEYLWMENDEDTLLDTFCVEGAFRIRQSWQIAARYESIDYNWQDFPPEYGSLEEHKEFILGVNFWIRPNLVVKSSAHFIEGNNVVHPGTTEDFWLKIGTGGLKEKTQLMLLSVQFSF